MRAAHTCIRSALTQAFRAPRRSPSAVCTVPEFLVPGLRPPPRRPLSTSRVPRPPPARPVKPPQEPFPLRIPLPEIAARHDIQQWLAAIDPFLPPHLRQTPAPGSDKALPATPLDLAWVLKASQDALTESAQDLLCHMGPVEGRWATVVWIVKKLVEGGPRMLEPPLQLEPFANVVWPGGAFRTLDDLTQSPLLLERVPSAQRLMHTLDDKTATPDTIDRRASVAKRAVGQVWRSLGNMILAATGEPEGEESNIMPHVLEIIAYLHHAGLIPEAVYRDRPAQNHSALQQPPTLHLLSSKILTALSDATWRAHEASVKVAAHRLHTPYFLGHEIPGSYFKIKVTEVAPELWLELVLWSCVHGGWILDGAAILESVQTQSEDRGWSLISWRELLQATEREQPREPASRRWRLLSKRDANPSPTPDDRALTRRTLSSEVVAAFVDGLVNYMRVGVGARGSDPEDLVRQLKSLKALLDASSLSLGSASWDSVMVRLLESGGLVPENRPELLRTIVDLSSGFGAEVGSANSSKSTTGGDMEPPYFFEPSTAAISMLHRTMHSFLGIGDLSGALITLQALQQHTDHNKQKSLEQFFKKLQTIPLNQAYAFDSPPIEFPAFEPQVPIPLLAKLLDLITEAERYDVGRWLLFSQELDGPIIAEHMYYESTMAASILRFGTMSGEHDLVMGIVERASTWDNRQVTKRLPDEIMTALLRCQIQLQKWETVGAMRDHVLQNRGYRPSPEVLAHFVAVLLRDVEESKTKVKQAFKEFLFAWERPLLANIHNELNCVLAILSSLHPSWTQYTSQFMAYSSRQGIKLSVFNFNILLKGVLDGYGSVKGREVVDMWCHRPSKTFKAYHAAGGLPTMPTIQSTKSEELRNRPEDIEIIQPSGTVLTLQGRILPNRQTVWMIIRKVQQEVVSVNDLGAEERVEKRRETKKTLRWAARLLYYLGLDYEDIIRDFGSLAELAQIEAPPAREQRIT
ncbi:hypothetical protein P154DRAFT_436806 [Amniculicola lignicola CBS 123094]|uniref:Uncharacterized protein n=1 Tax=Amniculicola lignicola CBS 123094 TaxID=1392246 RepID=A0A6A5WFH2_9PLEO|nr:hypothetical protein P154DRAFT_436806 [Amniculicola lignicola CBS 123094]